MTDFLASMGGWPHDYNRQLDFWARLKVLLAQANQYVIDTAGEVVSLAQSTEPSQLQWENAWTTQTGLPLPIPTSAQLHWWNTSVNDFGGLYGTVEGSVTVYRRDHLYPRGGTIVMANDYKTDKITLTYAIGTNLTSYPKVTVDLPVACDLIMQFQLYVALSSGSGQWGADFLLNGVKVGTQYLGMASNMGIQNQSTSGLLFIEHTLYNLPAGEYTVQAEFGVTASPASPPTIIIGGLTGAANYGARQLMVRGIAAS